jgi:FMN phosphatase YigB (HAD superfamily)
MPARRHSRTPMVLTKDQQETLVKAADRDAATRERLERTFGVVWQNTTFQERLQLLHRLQEEGYALGSLAGALRGAREFDREITLREYGVDTEDRARQLEEQVAMLHEQLAERDATIKNLMGSKKKAAS